MPRRKRQESSMPATVKTPPTMAHSPVRKVERERRPSVTWGGGVKK